MTQSLLAEWPYAAQDHQTWGRLQRRLYPLHAGLATAEYLAVRDDVLGPPGGAMPTLSVASDRLTDATGFALRPAGGVVGYAEFFADLAAGEFPVNQAMRSPAEADFTPVPDWFHEAVGHAAALAVPAVAELYRGFGAAGGRCRTEADFRRLGKVFWFTAEVGLVREGGAVKAFGGALLSSVAELAGLADAEVRPFDLAAIEATRFDYKVPQRLYFVADSLAALCAATAARLAAW